jgi:hypothetical protein
MATDPDPYLAVLKASYDYEPQSDDEIAIKEDQLLFLIERVDDECVPRTHYSHTSNSPLTLVGGRSRSSPIPRVEKLPLALFLLPTLNRSCFLQLH